MAINRCRHCDVPILLMQFPAGERLWHHSPIIGVADEVGLLHDIRGAYFYCSSGHGVGETEKYLTGQDYK